jgi:PASTA domain
VRRWPVLIFTFAVACGAGSTSTLPSASSSSIVSSAFPSSRSATPSPIVASVLGSPYAQAKATLQAQGFEVARRFKFSSQTPGTVISQLPAPGASAEPGSLVTLVVAKMDTTPAGVRCPANPLRGVYHPYRLSVLKACQWFAGAVVAVRPEDDGDYHVDIRPNKGYGEFLDSGDVNRQHGGLLIEIMPGQKMPIPSVGDHVSVFGTWVYDTDHGWNELHPLWAMKDLQSAKLIVALPPITPKYHPDQPPPPTGGGGTNCDPAYPTVCIPPPPPDLDCGDISYRNFKVLSPDPHGFDGDHDGIGCET